METLTYQQRINLVLRHIEQNLDSRPDLDELARIDILATSLGVVPRVGLRVNPQAGLGRIKATSVAGRYSKFGVPIAARDAIHKAFARYPWLGGLHVHVGSQGCPWNCSWPGSGRFLIWRGRSNRSRGLTG